MARPATIARLKAAILGAHIQGDERALGQLQALYRKHATLESSSRGMAVQPIQHKAATASKTKVKMREERVAVELSPAALEEIRRSAFVYTSLPEPDGDGRETGGYLFGAERDGVIYVDAATTDFDECTATSVRLGKEPADAIGDWHSHPDDQGLELSPADWRHVTERASCGLRSLVVVVGRNGGRLLSRGYELRRESGGGVAAYPLTFI